MQICWSVCFGSSAEDTEAEEGALQAELHDLCAGCETEDLVSFLHWDGRWAAHKGACKKKCIYYLNWISSSTIQVTACIKSHIMYLVTLNDKKLWYFLPEQCLFIDRKQDDLKWFHHFRLEPWSEVPKAMAKWHFTLELFIVGPKN